MCSTALPAEVPPNGTYAFRPPGSEQNGYIAEANVLLAFTVQGLYVLHQRVFHLPEDG